MNPSEIPIDSSEVGDLVGACVPLALTAHAGAIVGVIVDTIVGAIDGELVGAVVADNTQSQKCDCGGRTQNTRIKRSGRVGRVILSKFEIVQSREQHMLAERPVTIFVTILLGMTMTRSWWKLWKSL